jgi:hypothetical protein
MVKPVLDFVTGTGGLILMLKDDLEMHKSKKSVIRTLKDSSSGGGSGSSSSGGGGGVSSSSSSNSKKIKIKKSNSHRFLALKHKDFMLKNQNTEGSIKQYNATFINFFIVFIKIVSVSWDVALNSRMIECGVKSVKCLISGTVLSYAWWGRNYKNPSQSLNRVSPEYKS